MYISYFGRGTTLQTTSDHLQWIPYCKEHDVGGKIGAIYVNGLQVDIPGSPVAPTRTEYILLSSV